MKLHEDENLKCVSLAYRKNKIIDKIYFISCSSNYIILIFSLIKLEVNVITE